MPLAAQAIYMTWKAAHRLEDDTPPAVGSAYAPVPGLSRESAEGGAAFGYDRQERDRTIQLEAVWIKFIFLIFVSFVAPTT